MKNPDMKQLALFAALIDSQSLSEAARRLDVTPSGASQSLNRLRDIMGDPLCFREGQGWQLTPFGEAEMPRIRAILETWFPSHAATETFDPLRCDAHLRIACHDGFGESALAHFCRTLVQEAPQLTFDLLPGADPATDLRRLREGSVDLALCMGPPPPHARDLRAVQATASPFTHACLMSDHPRIGRSLSMAEYLAEDHLDVDPAPGEAAGAPMNVIDRQLVDHGLMPRRLVRLHSWQLCTELLARTPRLLTATQAQATALCRHGRIRCLPLPSAIQWPVNVLHLAWHERSATLGHHRWARELLLEALQNGARSDTDALTPQEPATAPAAPVVVLATRRS
jgi:DNA-binding transcriptional LysR family regulator